MGRGSFGRPKPSPMNSTTASSPSQAGSSNGGEITALTGVVIPALEAALSRRSYHLQLRNKQDSNSSGGGGGNVVTAAALERRKQRIECHEHVKRLVGELSDRFRALDEWDERGEVGMGGEVAGFLEGFLEEVLVRVEPADD